jgi:hypothetical protein
VDCFASTLLLLLLMSMKEAAIVYLLITMAGWLFLVLVARRLILASHDYLFTETIPSEENGDARLRAILQRGIDENEFRYKYVPKTHLIMIGHLCIILGIIMGSIIWQPSLAITLPFSFVCVVDICYSSCFRFEDDDEDEGPPPNLIIQPADTLLVIQHTGTTRARTQAEEEQGGLV